MTWVTAERTASAVRASGAGVPPRRARGRRRRYRRGAALALGLAVALTACSDGGDSGDGPDGGATSSAAPGASAGTGPDGDAGGSPSAGAAGDLEGSWLATKDGQAVALMVNGGKAALFATGGTVCSGTTAEASGARTIRLTCTGSDERTAGKVEKAGPASLTVAWEGGLGEETYQRSEGGSLPPGLPTAGLGS